MLSRLLLAECAGQLVADGPPPPARAPVLARRLQTCPATPAPAQRAGAFSRPRAGQGARPVRQPPRPRAQGNAALSLRGAVSPAAGVPAPATPGAARAGGGGALACVCGLVTRQQPCQHPPRPEPRAGRRVKHQPCGACPLRGFVALRAVFGCPAPAPAASLRSQPRAPSGGFPPPSITARGCPPGVAVVSAAGRVGRAGRAGRHSAACPCAGRRRSPSGGCAGTACRWHAAARHGGRLFSKAGGGGRRAGRRASHRPGRPGGRGALRSPPAPRASGALHPHQATATVFTHAVNSGQLFADATPAHIAQNYMSKKYDLTVCKNSETI